MPNANTLFQSKNDAEVQEVKEQQVSLKFEMNPFSALYLHFKVMTTQSESKDIQSSCAKCHHLLILKPVKYRKARVPRKVHICSTKTTYFNSKT